MSIAALNWALNIEVSSSSQKLVLLLLSNFADEQGRSWPSQKVIAAKACLSVRSVVTALAELEKAGMIRREARWRPGGSRGTDVIHLEMTRTSMQKLHPSDIGEETAPLTKDAENVDQTRKISAAKGANPSPLTSFEPPLEPSKTLSEAVASGGKAAKPEDALVHLCWLEGKANIVACQRTEKAAGSYIGTLLGIGHTHAAILEASRAAVRAGTNDPMAFMRAILANGQKPAPAARREGRRTSAQTRFLDRLEARREAERSPRHAPGDGPILDHEGDGHPHWSVH